MISMAINLMDHFTASNHTSIHWAFLPQHLFCCTCSSSPQHRWSRLIPGATCAAMMTHPYPSERDAVFRKWVSWCILSLAAPLIVRHSVFRGFHFPKPNFPGGNMLGENKRGNRSTWGCGCVFGFCARPPIIRTIKARYLKHPLPGKFAENGRQYLKQWRDDVTIFLIH